MVPLRPRSSYQVTFSDLTDLTGATVEKQDLEKEIKEDDVRSALLGGEGGGVSYDLVGDGDIRLLLASRNICTLFRFSGNLKA